MLRSILDYLAAKRILAFRMNTGAMKIDKRFLRFGVPGMADIIAFPQKRFHIQHHDEWTRVLWIECKAGKGMQSELQKSFQEQVEEAGHAYLIAKSIDDVEAAL